MLICSHLTKHEYGKSDQNYYADRAGLFCNRSEFISGGERICHATNFGRIYKAYLFFKACRKRRSNRYRPQFKLGEEYRIRKSQQYPR